MSFSYDRFSSWSHFLNVSVRGLLTFVCRAEFRTVITLLNLSDLNEILLEHKINNIKTLGFSCS